MSLSDTFQAPTAFTQINSNLQEEDSEGSGICNIPFAARYMDFRNFSFRLPMDAAWLHISKDTRKRIFLSGQVSNQKVNIQGTFCIQAQISNSFAEATKPRCWHFCAGKMGPSATQQVRDVVNILLYRICLTWNEQTRDEPYERSQTFSYCRFEPCRAPWHARRQVTPPQIL